MLAGRKHLKTIEEVLKGNPKKDFLVFECFFFSNVRILFQERTSLWKQNMMENAFNAI